MTKIKNKEQIIKRVLTTSQPTTADITCNRTAKVT